MIQTLAMETEFVELLSNEVIKHLDALVVTATLLEYRIVNEGIDHKYDSKKDYKTLYFISDETNYELTFEMFKGEITGLHAIICYKNKLNDYDDIDDSMQPTEEEIIRVINSLMKVL